MLRSATAGIAASLTVIALASAELADANPMKDSAEGKPTTTLAAPPLPVATLTWGPCEEGVEPEFECATLPVPLDYANPAGESIGIALIRLPADPSRREGAVLLNPGGPGGSGFDFAANAGTVLDTDLGVFGHEVGDGLAWVRTSE